MVLSFRGWSSRSQLYHNLPLRWFKSLYYFLVQKLLNPVSEPLSEPDQKEGKLRISKVIYRWILYSNFSSDTNQVVFFLQEHTLSYFLRYRLSARLELASSTSGQTLLHTCAWFGTLAPMNLLLDHGCDPLKLNHREQSPLHFAALKGHRACVAALLKAGSDPMACDVVNDTPLHMAVVGSHYDCVRELLNNDEVDVNFPNVDGITVLTLNPSFNLNL
jgi:ankyrin repeat protein